jgi:hypothetical protein
MGDWLSDDKNKKEENIDGTREKTDSDMTRRDFLKVTAGTIGAIAAGAVAAKVGGEIWAETDENDRKQRTAELINAPTEKFQVIPWGEDVPTDDRDKPRTLDELRAAAGWDRSYQKEFFTHLREKYPKEITENMFIQPGLYEVPVRPLE